MLNNKVLRGVSLAALLHGALGVCLAIVLHGAFAGHAFAADDDGFVSIFDGKTLDGWDGDPKLWSVQDGAITGATSAEDPIKYNSFIIWRQGLVDDFELTLEYRIFGGNSGVQYRSFDAPKVGKWSVGGYQADFEAGDTWSGTLYGEQYRAILAKRGEKTVIGEDHKPKVVGTVGDADELAKKIKKGEWNTYHITAQGFHFTHTINGALMIDAEDRDVASRLRSGILALQLHAGPPMKMQVRNIKLKRLPMKDTKKIVLVAGKKSHGYFAHEHNAGCMLLADALNDNVPAVHAVVYRDGWPADPTAFDNADAVVMFCDGGDGHMVNAHLEQVDKLAKKGVGVVCLHYGVEVPKGASGDRFLDWIGGYFEMHWSVNPHWTAEFKELPKHPITQGVNPFTINDEWYYNMRFRENMEGITPILSAIPPESTLDRPDGPHSGNPHVRKLKGRPTVVAWALDRPGGGRGFGFTGAHFHWNWGHDDFRKLVLNALVWTAGADVPEGGVTSKTPTVEELEANQDFDKPADYKPEEVQKKLDEWNAKPAAVGGAGG